MTRRRVGVGLAIAGVTAIVACGYPPEGAVPKPLSPAGLQAAAARYPGVTPEQIADGEASFAARCNGCHHYPDRDAFTAEQWPGLVERMAPRAKLTAMQKEDVLHFVLASRKASS